MCCIVKYCACTLPLVQKNGLKLILKDCATSRFCVCAQACGLFGVTVQVCVALHFAMCCTNAFLFVLHIHTLIGHISRAGKITISS